MKKQHPPTLADIQNNPGIEWLVNRMSACDSDHKVARDLLARARKAGYSREIRHAIAREGIRVHHLNRRIA